MPAIPNAQPFSGANIAIPSIIGKEPKEGRKSIPYVINWNRPIAAGLDTVSFNPQGNSTLEFSQITGLIVDNSQCGASLDFIFPDTDVTISIPAYAPYTVLQVNSRAIEFYVRALGPLASDRTSFAILNYAPMPVSVPATSEQLTAGAIAASGLPGANTQIIPATTSGTVEDVSIGFGIINSASGATSAAWLQDGTGKRLAIVRPTVTNAQSVFQNLLDLSSVAIRFENGVSLQVDPNPPSLPGGQFTINLYYRTP